MKSTFTIGNATLEHDLTNEDITIKGVKQDQLVVYITESLNFGLEGNKWNYAFLVLILIVLTLHVVFFNWAGVVLTVALTVWHLTNFRKDINMDLCFNVNEQNPVE